MKFFKSSNKNTKGFTLIEISISLVILGIISAFLMQHYNIYAATQKENISKENLNQVISALEEYKSKNGFYPCPSSLSATRNLPEYGTTTATTACSVTTVAPGNCDAGQNYCVQESPDASLANRRIRIGAVPFRDVGVEEQNSYDGYKNRIFYAVSESLTNSASYNENNGGIGLVDENGQTISTAFGVDRTKFLIFTAGKNKVGGFNMNGQVGNPCNIAYNAMDAENCDFLRGATAGLFRFSPASDVPGPNFYDDRVQLSSAQNKKTSDGWRLGIASSGENINDTILASSGNVKAGDRTGPATEKLTIDGGLRLDGDAFSVTAREYCNQSGNFCLRPTDLVRTCPAGQFITGIAIDSGTYPRPICGVIRFACPTGQIISGKDSNNMPICITPPPYTGPGPAPVLSCTSQTQSVPHACPVGRCASGTQLQTLNCGTGVFTNSGATPNCDSNLSESGSESCGWGTTGSPPEALWTRSRPLLANGTCGAFSNRVYSTTCNCASGVIIRDEPVCGPNEVGDICSTVSLDFVSDGPASCVVGSSTVITPGSCRPAVFEINAGQVLSTSSSNPGLVQIGQTCAVGVPVGNCQRDLGGGNGFRVYSNCPCVKRPSPCVQN